MIIVSAGAFNTPKLLMLSGIGPKEELEAVGIDVNANLPVGQRFFDHPSVGLNFKVNYHKSLATDMTFANYDLYQKDGKGPLTLPFVELIGYYGTKYRISDDVPDLSVSLFWKMPPTLTEPQSTESSESLGGQFDLEVALSRSKSCGTVGLNQTHPHSNPIVDPKFLSSNIDLLTLVEGLKFLLEIGQSPSMKKYKMTLVKPHLPKCDKYSVESQKYLECYVRHMTDNSRHPTSTAPMGTKTDTYSVIDSDLKVHGIEGLRVADASVFPYPLACHTMAPTIMVGEMAADKIKRYYARDR